MTVSNGHAFIFIFISPLSLSLSLSSFVILLWKKSSPFFDNVRSTVESRVSRMLARPTESCRRAISFPRSTIFVFHLARFSRCSFFFFLSLSFSPNRASHRPPVHHSPRDVLLTFRRSTYFRFLVSC